MHTQPEITAAQLRVALEAGENLQLVFALGAHAYAEAHIPGSLHFSDPRAALRSLDPALPVVVYCSDDTCSASMAGQYLLIREGFADVRRLTGGLAAWIASGNPVEGRSHFDSA